MARSQQKGRFRILGGVDPPFILAYLDDFLVEQSPLLLVKHPSSVSWQSASLLGLKLNLSKCHLEPTQCSRAFGHDG
jgi:hypothetical protein